MARAAIGLGLAVLAGWATPPASGQDTIQTTRPREYDLPSPVSAPPAPPAVSVLPEPEPVTLNPVPGFEPDPLWVGFQARAGNERAGDGACTGFVSNRPAAIVQYAADRYPMSFSGSGFSGNIRLTTPDGDEYCAPAGSMVTVSPAQSGEYQIHTLTGEAGERISGSIGVSEIRFAPRPITTPSMFDAEMVGGEGLLRTAGNLTQTVTVEFGQNTPLRFLARPQETTLLAFSGSTPCRGYFGTEPALSLGARFVRSLRVSTDADADAMLLVRRPDGQWLCDDDSGIGLNAALILDQVTNDPWLVYVGYYQDHFRSPDVTLVVEPDFDRGARVK